MGKPIRPKAVKHTAQGPHANRAQVDPQKPEPDMRVPGEPVDYNYGLLWLIYGLLWGIVACYFGLLGVPGKC